LEQSGSPDFRDFYRDHDIVRVALIHDWLNGMRGGEKVLEALCELFPDAVVFTLFYVPAKVSKKISRHEVIASYLDRIPGMRRFYRNMLPLYPTAMESLKLDDFDLCISVSHSVAKGIRPGPNSLHICICLTPMRYIWDRFDDYFHPKDSGQLKRYFARMLCMRLRRWDIQSSARVDLFVAISDFVQRRIRKFYNRPSTVIYPFADTDYFTPGVGDLPSCSGRIANGRCFFLAVSALVPYKRIQDIVEAFRHLDERVVIVGDGPEKKRLMQTAPPNVEFTGWLSDEHLLNLYRSCEALLFPGVEDFGIVPVEAQACGKPVIALAEGGTLETVSGPIWGINRAKDDHATGLLFRKPGPEYIIEAIKAFRTMTFDGNSIRKNALRFSRPTFLESMSEFVNRSFARFKAGGRYGLEEYILSEFDDRAQLAEMRR
jgi:glycosyltransferase involved in cell wall biosynthesis